jgi:hypothetical protein
MAKKKTITTTKTLIEKSIVINGMGRPDIKTIFTIENESEKNDTLYRSLERISGRKLTIDFKYSEGDTEVPSKLLLSIPFDLDEDGVKTFILDEINKTLA